VKNVTNQQMKVIKKWNSNEIVGQCAKLVIAAHLKNKIGFISKNVK
jgi:hypothetical protein